MKYNYTARMNVSESEKKKGATEFIQYQKGMYYRRIRVDQWGLYTLRKGKKVYIKDA